jgi:hypothetical protein
MVRVAIDVHSELQILTFEGFHLVSDLHYTFFFFDNIATILLPKL